MRLAGSTVKDDSLEFQDTAPSPKWKKIQTQTGHHLTKKNTLLERSFFQKSCQSFPDINSWEPLPTLNSSSRWRNGRERERERVERRNLFLFRVYNFPSLFPRRRSSFPRVLCFKTEFVFIQEKGEGRQMEGGGEWRVFFSFAVARGPLSRRPFPVFRAAKNIDGLYWDEGWSCATKRYFDIYPFYQPVLVQDITGMFSLVMKRCYLQMCHV